MRIEIRVRPVGMDWEVHGTDGITSHPTRAAALRQARESARATWVEAHCPAAVKELCGDLWSTDVFFGLEGLHA